MGSIAEAKFVHRPSDDSCITKENNNNTVTTVLNANNAVISRLLTCMVNEQLVDAYIVAPPTEIVQRIPSSGPNLHQWCQVSKIGYSSQRRFWICLRKNPVGNPKVHLLDPEDFNFPVFTSFSDSDCLKITKLNDPTDLMSTLSQWHILDPQYVEEINLELQSSVDHLYHAFRNLSSNYNYNLPVLGDPGINWEQSIVEGHPTHPMNKSRHAIPPLPPIPVEMDLNNVTVHFFAVPRSKMIISGNYEELIQPILRRVEKLKSSFDFDKETIIPVHELQIPNILEKFPFARHLSNITESALAQCSLRTVLIPNLPGLVFKLAIGVKISSAMRTITPGTAKLSPTLKFITDKVIDDKDILIGLNELGSITSNHPDSDIAKHLTCMIREDADAICSPREEIVIVCAALTEKNPVSEEFAVVRAFQLNTEAKRVNFFKKYAEIYLKAFVAPMSKYGFTFEAHLQNALARFKMDENGTYNLTGFTIRDFGGISVYQKQLKEVTGIDMDFGGWRNAKNVEEIHRVAFHTMIQMHLHRVIRALDLHYNGLGWEIVRNELGAILPKNSVTRKLWLESSKADYKCFITMKLFGLYADYLYCEVPNLITCSAKEEVNGSGTSGFDL